jgi:hypothetical protein
MNCPCVVVPLLKEIANCFVSSVLIETLNEHKSPAAKSRLDGGTGDLIGFAAAAFVASAPATTNAAIIVTRIIRTPLPIRQQEAKTLPQIRESIEP